MLSIRASNLVISSFLAPVEASIAARLFIILRNKAISVCNDGEAGAGEGGSGRGRAVGRSLSTLELVKYSINMLIFTYHPP